MPGSLVELLRRPRYEVFPLAGIEDELAETERWRQTTLERLAA